MTTLAPVGIAACTAAVVIGLDATLTDAIFRREALTRAGDAVPDSHATLFIRRGGTVTGPVPYPQVFAQFKAGTLAPSDEIASLATGPWIELQTAFLASPPIEASTQDRFAGLTSRPLPPQQARPTQRVQLARQAPQPRQSQPSLPVVDSFDIKRALLGGGYIAYYQCPRCDFSLESAERDMEEIETCPQCRLRYRLSPRAADEACAARLEYDRQRAEAAARAQEERDRKAAERRAEADRREAVRRRQDAEKQRADAARQRQEEADRIANKRLLDAARAKRSRAGACWHCGVSVPPAMPQCIACRMPRRAASP